MFASFLGFTQATVLWVRLPAMRFLIFTLWSSLNSTLNTSSGDCSSSSIRTRRATVIYSSQGLGLIKIRKLLNQVTGSINEVFRRSELKNSLHLTSNKSQLENIVFLSIQSAAPPKNNLLGHWISKSLALSKKHTFFSSLLSPRKSSLGKKNRNMYNPFGDSLWILFYIFYDFILVK